MSVHFVADQPLVKKQWKPWWWEMITEDRTLDQTQMKELISKMYDEIEHLDDAFIEINKPYSQVLQIWPYRVVVVQPPLVKRIEITAVRPVTTRTLGQYELEDKIQNWLLYNAKWVLITGAPGEGKSTFATAFVNELAKSDVIIKTIESPRDLQVNSTISQYSFSHAPHSEIRDILLLSRPDFTIYDEVRNKEDFLLFKDLRLTGIWLIWVMHATHAIDGVQRMLWTIEMGLIPQIIDTVIFIKAWQINQIFTLEQTVKAPEWMASEDLARPVVLVKDLITDEAKYEMYSYGESVVVMPLDQMKEASNAKKNSTTWIGKFAKRWLQDYFRKELWTQVAIQIENMSRIRLYVPSSIIPRVIWRQWANIQRFEKELWLSIWVKEMSELWATDATIPFEIDELNKWKKMIIQIRLAKEFAHQEITCLVWSKMMSFTANHQATIQIRRKKLIDHIRAGEFAIIS